MFQTVRTRIALAAAALAIVATSFAPAVSTFAAPLAPSQEDAMVAKPDLKITLINLDQDHMDFVGSFFVENIGPGAASPVMVKILGNRYDVESESYLHFDCAVKLLPPLKKGEHTYVHFTCEDASGAQATVMTPNDSDLSNNVQRMGTFGRE